MAGPDQTSESDGLPSAADLARSSDFPSADLGERGTFAPIEPSTLEEAGLTETEVEALILKFLHTRAEASGWLVSQHLRLPFHVVAPSLDRLRAARLISYRTSSGMNDFDYQISDAGMQAAQHLASSCAYSGAAPVPLDDYVEAVLAQGTAEHPPGPADLAAAFDGLIVEPDLMARIGPAIASGRGMFLFGPPGNGKSSIAHRITRSLGGLIWVPRVIGVDGEIIRVFDPQHHVEVPLKPNELLADGRDVDGRRIDERWVRIERPTVRVGGELTMDQLEVTRNPVTGISEAPLQLKANGGTLLIDDFGRQRMPVAELLNRWIVPLEHNIDYYSLASGRRITMPFMQVIVFSTNLEPKDLVDEAFLRRIPYKISVGDPSHAQYRALFNPASQDLGVAIDPAVIEHLITTHYVRAGRGMRFCHPRDLLLQIRNESLYLGVEARMTRESIDRAVAAYFSIL